MRPGLSINSSKTSYSLAVSRSSAPPERTSRVSLSSSTTPHDTFLGPHLTPAVKRLKPSDQLDERKRFSQVVVAELEPSNPVGERLARSQKKDRLLKPCAPHLPRKLESGLVSLGQHHVEQNKVEGLRPQNVPGSSRRMDQQRFETAGPKPLTKSTGYRNLIFNDEQAHFAHYSPISVQHERR